jgi:hypothetical protein
LPLNVDEFRTLEKYKCSSFDWKYQLIAVSHLSRSNSSLMSYAALWNSF